MLSPIIFLLNGIIGSYIFLNLIKLFENSIIIFCFAKLGKYTVTILCTHYFIFRFVMAALKGLNIHGFWFYFITLGAAVIIGIFLKEWVIKFEKYIPLAKYL